MKTRILGVAAAAAVGLLAGPAQAQVSIVFQVPPPVVVVEPGIQVVEDNDDEIFFVNNVYWVRRGPQWYRAADHRGGWVVVDGPGVPPALVRMPQGKYRRYKHGKTVVIDTPGPGKVKVKKGKWK